MFNHLFTANKDGKYSNNYSRSLTIKTVIFNQANMLHTQVMGIS